MPKINESSQRQKLLKKKEESIQLIIKTNNVSYEEALILLKKYSKRNKKYWLIQGYSEKDAIKESRTRMPGTIEYFMYFKNINDINECKKLSKQWGKDTAITLENQIRLYGEEIGELKFNNYCKKQAYSNTLEYMINKYGIEEGTKKYYTANEKRAVTLPNLIKNHGKKEGTKIWENYLERQAYTNTKEYFVELYGEEKGIEKYKHINFLKSHSYESYLERCDGDIELATQKLAEYWRKVDNYKNTSLISIELFNELLDFCLNNNWKKIFYETYTQEWYLSIRGFGFTKVDFFIKETGKIIEFYGDYWHANPLIYEPNEFINYPQKQRKKAKDIWKHDELRINAIKRMPYIKDILIIWEHDYRKNKNDIIKKCKQFLIT